MTLKDKKKKGWYLEMKHRQSSETRVDTPISYEKHIEVASNYLKDPEKVTSKALKLAAKEGIFYNSSQPQDIIMHLNYYKKGVITSRYIMEFNTSSNHLLGHYKEWVYYSVDLNGKAELYKHPYSLKSVIWLPITLTAIFILLLFITHKDIFTDDLSKTIFAFVAFFIMLVYSVILLLIKDRAKYFFAKGKLKPFWGTILFEAPYWLSAYITVYKLSIIKGNLNSSIFLTILLCVYIFLFVKLVISIALEKEKLKV
ncbi:hypothetical protein ACT1UG_26505 [Bacillus paramycoides]|uniref:hypothetical protein n=1 Tax=Bacillus paramycoides TaxID=2026194 RepID=UPI0040589F14